MVFKVHATFGSVRMTNGEWKLTLAIPASDGVEMAKICCACQEEPLEVTIETEVIEPIGQQA